MRVEGNGANAPTIPVEEDPSSQSTQAAQPAADTAKKSEPDARRQAPPAPLPTPTVTPTVTRLQRQLARPDGDAAYSNARSTDDHFARPVSAHAAPHPHGQDDADAAAHESSTPGRTKRGNPHSGPPEAPNIERPTALLPIPPIAAYPPTPTQIQYLGHPVALRASTSQGATPQERVNDADRDALYRPASDSVDVSAYELANSGAAEPQDRRRANAFGTAMAIMGSAAVSPSSSSLYDTATHFRTVNQAGGAGADSIHASIASLERNGEWNGDARDIPNYIRHPGTTGLQGGHALVNDLQTHFSAPYNPRGEPLGHPNGFALIGLTLGSNAPSAQNPWRPNTTVAVQRVHATSDYRNDTYMLYHPTQGAFRYENFNQLAFAVENYYATAYPVMRGFTSASTSYYAMQNVMQHPLAGQHLGAFGDSYGIPALPLAAPPLAASDASQQDSQPASQQDSQRERVPSLTPPQVNLPPPPDIDRPGPSGYQPARTDLKRSAEVEGERQPMALYRPSNMSPADLKKLGGFSAEQTPLGRVSLDMHNFDVASTPGVIDGAGYLGTFRKLDTAQQNPALAGAANGYIYAVAPTPNMVDVNSTLGTRARDPGAGEVAAMGRIDYTQIRGWQKIENGKPGQFVANPDYRWDVYDQTRTAGAQPQLARFAAGDPAWGDSARRPFAVEQKQHDKAVYAPRQDPDLTQASFYHHALEKVAWLTDRQAKGEDHRGPVDVISHNGRYGTLQANVHTPQGQVFSLAGPAATSVTVVPSAKDVDGFHQFRIGDDGRFHTRVVGQDEVLRVGGDGYLYLDYPPKDQGSTNGVFRYENNRLIHQEDGKVLTWSSAGYPYVSSKRSNYDSDYSQWKLTDGSNMSYSPPKSLYAYHATGAGSARAQFEFDKDPDSALPTGATHFATRLPGGVPVYDTARSFMQDTTPAEQQRTLDWLSGNNAALLFKDGFYLTATADHTLEVRNLQGLTVSTVRTDAASQDSPSDIRSDYSVSEQTWARLKDEQTRREQLEEQTRTAYATVP